MTTRGRRPATDAPAAIGAPDRPWRRLLDRPGPALGACALAVFLVRLLFLHAFVPPWQYPDEPQHVFVARALSLVPDLNDATLVEPTAPEVEQEIVASMVRHRWWEYNEMAAADPLPEGMLAATGLAPGVGGSILYHAAVSRVLRWLEVDTLAGQVSFMRALSSVMGVLSLLLAWRAATAAFGPREGGVAAMMLAVHPQFALGSVAAHPDVALACCGTVVWYASARWWARTLPMAPAAALALTAGVLAMLTRRAGITVLLCALLLAIAMSASALRRRHLAWRMAGVAVVVLIGIVASFIYWPSQWNRVTYSWWFVIDAAARSWRAPNTDALHSYAFASVWFAGGWLTLAVPPGWTAGLVALHVAAGVGLARGARWRRRGARSLTVRPPRGAELIALALVGVVVTVAVVPALAGLAGLQGRYFLPAAAPWAALLGAGVCRLPWRLSAAAIGFLVALDLVIMLSILGPAYAD